VQSGDPARVSIRAVSEAVGCTPPAIYLHFSDKGALLAEVARRALTAFEADAGPRADGSDTARSRAKADPTAEEDDADSLQRLRDRAEAYIRLGLRYPHHYRLLTASGSLGHDLAASALLGPLVDSVQSCVVSGSISDEHPPVHVALSLWAACHGVVSLLISAPEGERLVDDQRVDGLIELALDIQLEGLLAI